MNLGRDNLTMQASPLTLLIIREFHNQNQQGEFEELKPVLYEDRELRECWFHNLLLTCPALFFIDDGTFATIWMIVAFITGLMTYFLPSLIGDRKVNKWAIFVLNLLAGWTIVGWIVAMVWACTSEPSAPPAPAQVPPTTVYCGHCGQPATGRFCGNCGTPTGRA